MAGEKKRFPGGSCEPMQPLTEDELFWHFTNNFPQVAQYITLLPIIGRGIGMKLLLHHSLISNLKS